MISLTYAKAILNALFHTGGSSGMTADEELAALKAKGVPSDGATTNMYAMAYIGNNYQHGGETAKKYDEMKELVNQSEWHYTETYSETIEITKYEDGEPVKTDVAFRGWRILERTEQQMPYPSNSYLALFTTMPNENGSEYVEPSTDSEGNSTNYMRVNLKEGIVTGNISLNKATVNADTGESEISNKELIMYPEVCGADWGTIVGIGVFTSETVGEGAPVFWGRINNAVPAEVEHVPLFRVGDFKVTLQ